MKSTLMIGLSLVAVLAINGCGSKSETAQPMATVVAPKSVVVQLPATELVPVAEPAVVASAPVAAVPVMPSVFSAPTLTLDVPDNQLFSSVLETGYDSKLEAFPANYFLNSEHKWAQLAAAIRNGKPDPEIVKLSTKPWTKPINYLLVGKRTVVFAALVKGMTPTSGFDPVRQVLVVIAGIDETGKPLVVSVKNVPFVDRNCVFAPVLSNARPPLDLSLNEFIDLRESIVQALRT